MAVKLPNCGHPAGGAADPVACPTIRPCCCNLLTACAVANFVSLPGNEALCQAALRVLGAVGIRTIFFLRAS